MNRKLPSIAAGLLCLAALASAAQPAAPEPILPEALKWSGPPSNPKLKGSWVMGAESEPGLYAFRAMLKEGDLYAKDGDVVYQESGAGPTATLPLGR